MKQKQIGLFSLFLLLDQMTKIFAIEYLQNSIIVIPGFFELFLTYNTGAAWSILENQVLLLLFVSVVALYFLLKLAKTLQDTWLKILIFSNLYAGIIGNMIDRIFYGAVIDFLKFTIFGYDFPIFNLADIFIVLSGFGLLIIYGRGEENGKNNC